MEELPLETKLSDRECFTQTISFIRIALVSSVGDLCADGEGCSGQKHAADFASGCDMGSDG